MCLHYYCFYDHITAVLLLELRLAVRPAEDRAAHLVAHHGEARGGADRGRRPGLRPHDLLERRGERLRQHVQEEHVRGHDDVEVPAAPRRQPLGEVDRGEVAARLHAVRAGVRGGQLEHRVLLVGQQHLQGAELGAEEPQGAEAAAELQDPPATHQVRVREQGFARGHRGGLPELEARDVLYVYTFLHITIYIYIYHTYYIFIHIILLGAAAHAVVEAAELHGDVADLQALALRPRRGGRLIHV